MNLLKVKRMTSRKKNVWKDRNPVARYMLENRDEFRIRAVYKESKPKKITVRNYENVIEDEDGN